MKPAQFTTVAAIAIAAAALLSAAGCATQTTTISRSSTFSGGATGRAGIVVEVYRAGPRLYGNPIDRKTLVKRLLEEEMPEDAKSQKKNRLGILNRAVLLEEKEDVPLKELMELREFLVRNKIPNVVIVTMREGFSFVDERL